MTIVLQRYVAQTGPPIGDTVTVDPSVDLTGSTAKFRMRLRTASALTTDAAALTWAGALGTASGTYQLQTADVATAGDYVFWWHITTATGAFIDTNEATLTILAHAAASAPGNIDLCTVADVRAILELDAAYSTRDALIQEYITDASQAVMRYTEREILPVTVGGAPRRFKVNVETRRVDLGPYDLQSVSAMTLNPEDSSPITLLAETGYRLGPLQSEWGTYKKVQLSPFVNVFPTGWVLYGSAQVDITGTWGFPAVPRDVKLACARTVASWLDKAVDAYGIHDMLDQPRGVAPAQGVSYGLPPGALRLLGPLCRKWLV